MKWVKVLEVNEIDWRERESKKRINWKWFLSAEAIAKWKIPCYVVPVHHFRVKSRKKKEENGMIMYRLVYLTMMFLRIVAYIASYHASKAVKKTRQ